MVHHFNVVCIVGPLFFLELVCNENTKQKLITLFFYGAKLNYGKVNFLFVCLNSARYLFSFKNFKKMQENAFDVVCGVFALFGTKGRQL